MTVFGLVRSAVGNSESARSEYLGPTGKRSAGKLACSVWSGGKAVRPYLSLFDVILCSALAAAERQPVGVPPTCGRLDDVKHYPQPERHSPTYQLILSLFAWNVVLRLLYCF